MGTTYRIKINMKPEEVRKNLRNLARVLSGKDQTHNSFRQKFWGIFTREMFRRIQASYRARSRGEADDLGNVWHPLKKKTVSRKKREHFRGGLHPGVKVPPSPHPNFINRDTEELFKSLAMGALGATYKPVEDQVYSLSGSTITLGTSAIHSEAVNRRRKLIPREVGPWVKESLAIAIQKTVHLVPKLG